jgi:hypothetical protein
VTPQLHPTRPPTAHPQPPVDLQHGASARGQPLFREQSSHEAPPDPHTVNELVPLLQIPPISQQPAQICEHVDGLPASPPSSGVVAESPEPPPSLAKASVGLPASIVDPVPESLIVLASSPGMAPPSPLPLLLAPLPEVPPLLLAPELPPEPLVSSNEASTEPSYAEIVALDPPQQRAQATSTPHSEVCAKVRLRHFFTMP